MAAAGLLNASQRLSIAQSTSRCLSAVQRQEDIELKMGMVEDACPVYVVAKMDQVPVNLVVNARDAMPQGGVLTIETTNVVLDEPYAARHVSTEPGKYGMLVSRNLGPGMDDEVNTGSNDFFFTTGGQRCQSGPDHGIRQRETKPGARLGPERSSTGNDPLHYLAPFCGFKIGRFKLMHALDIPMNTNGQTVSVQEVSLEKARLQRTAHEAATVSEDRW